MKNIYINIYLFTLGNTLKKKNHTMCHHSYTVEPVYNEREGTARYNRVL